MTENRDEATDTEPEDDEAEETEVIEDEAEQVKGGYIEEDPPRYKF